MDEEHDLTKRMKTAYFEWKAYLEFIWNEGPRCISTSDRP